MRPVQSTEPANPKAHRLSAGNLRSAVRPSQGRRRRITAICDLFVRETTRMILRLTLEYDGTGFRGWARQPGQRTIEGVVRDALDAVYPRWDALAVAGRTDTGVHADGQVASVEVEGGPPAERAPEALNTALPDDVAVLEAAEAPPGFHARFSARARSYRYVVLDRRERSALEARRALWWPRPVDLEALSGAARLVLGEHDFRAFTPDGDAARRVRARGDRGRLGAAGTTASTSRSPRTRSCATWCGRWSARCSSSGRQRRSALRSCCTGGRGPRRG